MRRDRAILRGLVAAVFTGVVLVGPMVAIDKPFDAVSLALVGLLMSVVGAVAWRHSSDPRRVDRTNE